ncbi:putative phosphomevalonate kinase, partial [Ananas comosus]
MRYLTHVDSANPFVEQAVQYAVAASKVILIEREKKDILDKLLLQGLNITILGCNDFYSYRNQIEARGLPLTPDVLASIPPFSSITFNSEVRNGNMAGEKCKPEVAKTGLGSSAAMTTSVVAALLHYLGVVTLPSTDEKATAVDLDLVHVISQSAHCIAQGKVGSGFDVSAAVYGSQRYIRFSPEVLSSSQHLPDVVADILKQKWNHENFQFSLPPLLTLLLGSPVLEVHLPHQWWLCQKVQKSEPQKSLETWQKSLLGARNAFVEIRSHMRQMGNAAGVPIEPESQTQLLDTTMEMEGVLLAGVPGAGGFDAVFAIILGEASNAVAKAWSSLGLGKTLVAFRWKVATQEQEKYRPLFLLFRLVEPPA